MAENVPPQDGPVTALNPTPPAVTAGQMLKAARLKAGVHLSVLSVALKVPVRQLEALEADKYQQDQSPVFARAMVASVCRQLHLDPAPILALMPLGVVSFNVPSLSAPENMGALNQAPPVVSAKVVLVVALMLALLAALIWLPSPSQWPWLTVLSTDAAETTTSEVSSSVSTAVSADVVSLGGISVVPSVSVQQAPEPLTVVSKPQAAAQSAAQPELIFTASDACWIEVRDDAKKVVWTGVLSAGESKSLLLSKPLRVAVGRVDALKIQFKGQGFDLSPYTQSNVARFEVAP